MSLSSNPISSSTIGIGANYSSAFKNAKKEYEDMMLSSKEGSKAASGWHNMQSDEAGKALRKQQLAANYKQHASSLKVISEKVRIMREKIDSIQKNVEKAVEIMQYKPLDLSRKDHEGRMQQIKYYLSRIEESLNAKYSDGRYIFGGARSDALPVDEIVRNSNIISSKGAVDDSITSVYYNGDINPAISYTIGHSSSIKLNFNAADPGVRKTIAALHYCIDAEEQFIREEIDQHKYVEYMEHAEQVGDEAVKSLSASILDISMVLQHIEIDTVEHEKMLNETEGSLNDLMRYNEIDIHRFLIAHYEQLNMLSNIYMLSHKFENNFINNLALMS